MLNRGAPVKSTLKTIGDVLDVMGACSIHQGLLARLNENVSDKSILAKLRELPISEESMSILFWTIDIEYQCGWLCNCGQSSEEIETFLRAAWELTACFGVSHEAIERPSFFRRRLCRESIPDIDLSADLTAALLKRAS